MKNFEDVHRFEAEANSEAGIYLDDAGEFVLYDDYKELLEAYLQLKYRLDGLDK